MPCPVVALAFGAVAAQAAVGLSHGLGVLSGTGAVVDLGLAHQPERDDDRVRALGRRDGPGEP